MKVGDGNPGQNYGRKQLSVSCDMFPTTNESMTDTYPVQHELRKRTILLNRKPAIQIIHNRLDSECVRGRFDSPRILRDRAGRRAIQYVLVQWRPS